MKNFITRLIHRVRHQKYQKAISADSIEDRFTNIYNKNLWFANKQSKSGSGSRLEAKQYLSEFLLNFLIETKAKNLTDLGCGDFYWMKEVPLPCRYIGLDVVAPIIEENQQKYADDRHQFYHYNAVEDPIPDETDVILCREVLFHLSIEDGIKLIKNILESRVRYFLVTTSDTVQENKDIRTGQFRNINLQLTPYFFPPYVNKVNDDAVSADRILGIWEVSKLRKNLPY